MAQLYFRYSTMNAGKSLEILRIAHNYEEKGSKVLLFTSDLDDRFQHGYIVTRAGLGKPAWTFNEETKFYVTVYNYHTRENRLSCILIDEAQFLIKEQVMELASIVDDFNIPVIAYGLKNDFRNELFEGSKYLLVYADKIEEVKTVCKFCERKATMILKVVDGHPVYDGDQIEIGDKQYISVCRRHYHNPPVNLAADEGG